MHDTIGNTQYTGFSERRGTYSFPHADRHGSHRFRTNAAGAVSESHVWDAFGREPVGGGSTSPLGYGGAWDYQSDGPLGMQLLGHRYYDPEAGRFLSPDPIGHAGGLNLYAYCEGDPVNRVDPSGLDWVIGDTSNPLLVFTAEGTSEGLQTGLAAVGSAFSFGAWDGGCYKSKAGFGESRVMAEVGRDALITAGTAGGGNAINAARLAAQARRMKAAQDAIKGYRAARLNGLSIPRGSSGVTRSTAPLTRPWPSPGLGAQKVNGIHYTSHALERMSPVGLWQKGSRVESRGVPPSVVENAIWYGSKSIGRTPGTVIHVFENVTVVTNNSFNRVITILKKGH